MSFITQFIKPYYTSKLKKNIDTHTYISTGVNSYWCCAAYPDDGGLLGVGIFCVNVDALLQVEQQGNAGHAAEHDVQAEIERIHLCSDTKKQTVFGLQIHV